MKRVKKKRSNRWSETMWWASLQWLKVSFHTVEFFGVIWTKQIDKNKIKNLFSGLIKPKKKKKKMEKMFRDHVISKSPMDEGEFHTVEFLWCDLEKADKQKKKKKRKKEREQIHSSLQFFLSPGTKSLWWEKMCPTWYVTFISQEEAKDHQTVIGKHMLKWSDDQAGTCSPGS